MIQEGNRNLRFKYIIVTEKERINSVIEEYTVFNLIPNRFINSTSALSIISYFPATLEEFLNEWPISSFSCSVCSEYDICFINESCIEDTFYRYIKEYKKFGILFINKDVREEIVCKLIDNCNMPIVDLNVKRQKACYNIDDDQLITKIYTKLYETVAEEVGKFNLSIEQIGIRVNESKNEAYAAPIAKYLDPLTITIDKIRGLNVSRGNGIKEIQPVSPQTFIEYENMADAEINKAIKTILAEKFLTTKLISLRDNTITKQDELILNSLGLDKEELNLLLLHNDFNKYQYIAKKIFNNLEKLDFRIEMTLCIPSINYEFIKPVVSERKFGDFLSEGLKLQYDMNAYYGLINTKMLKKDNKVNISTKFMCLNYLIGERAKETAFLSYLFLYTTLSQSNPYIRTRNVATSKIYEKLEAIRSKNIEEITPNEITSMVKTIGKYISKSIFNTKNNLHNLINKYCDHLTVISDLPVEWIEINHIPLYVRGDVSRIPITPGDNILRVMQNNHIYNHICQNNLKILVVNALNEKEKSYYNGKKLKDKIVRFIPERFIMYVVVKNKQEYLETIKRERPQILIHFGHGGYDLTGQKSSSAMSGILKINEDLLIANELNEIDYCPPIVILGACLTEVVQGPIYNIANTFLANGTTSVIGTFMPVYDDYILEFITCLMKKMWEVLKESSCNQERKWADIIRLVRREMYLKEPIYCLKYAYTQYDLYDNWVEYVEENDIFSNILDYCKENKVSKEELLNSRDKVYRSVLKKNIPLREVFNRLLIDNAIIPYSSFITSLGYPDKIILK